MVTEGKMARGWRLTRESWSIVSLRPGLLVIPAVSAVATAIAAVALLGPWSLDAIGHHSRERMAVDAAICAFPFTLISTFCNVAFAALAAAAVDGRPMTVRQAFARARSRLGAIVLWSLIATLVGIVLRSLEQLPVAGGWLGRAAEFIGGVAWSLASFFVVPVLALEDATAPEALRTSAATIRRTWGESVTGAVVIGSAFGIAGVFAASVGGIGLGLGLAGLTPAFALAIVGGVGFAATIVAQSAVSQLFRLAVFRYATGSGAVGPYAVTDLEAAFRPSNRRFWR